MQTVKIALEDSVQQTSYCVNIGKDVLSSFVKISELETYSSFLIVVDENLKELPWFSKFKKEIIAATDEEPRIVFTTAGEAGKNIKTASELWSHYQAAGLDRKSLVVSLGGGAVCDLNGFAASTYMRGMSFIHIPTTLLSQVDASIGGKTGINFNEIKNLVGTFNQPKMVLIDPSTLSTLPERELNSGYAEVIKHGLIQDAKYFENVRISFEQKNDQDYLEQVIADSCKIKARVVEQDVREGGLRKVLNFGHTFGHAIESLSYQSPKPYLHGEAISIGMVAEAKLSEFLGYLTHKEVLEIEDTFKNYKLPVRLAFDVQLEDIIKKISSDKKNSNSKINWSLLKKIGSGNFDQVVSQEQIKEALQYISSS